MSQPDVEQLTSLPLESNISQVTVYSGQARVTRQGTIELSGAERELVLAGLPATLQTESVRVSGQGTTGLRLQGVRAERIALVEPDNARLVRLNDQIEQLEEQLRQAQDGLRAVELQREFVQTLGQQSAEQLSRSLARRQTGLDDASELLNFLGRHYSDFSTRLVGQQREIRRVERELEALRRQRQLIQNPILSDNYNLFIGIEPVGAGQFALEISYMVNQAGWQPLYDLRAGTGSDKLSLTYLAAIQQRTGEDWNGVKLTLSTAKANLGSLPPKLDPWYITGWEPALMRSGRARAVRGSGGMGRDFAPGAMPAPKPQDAFGNGSAGYFDEERDEPAPEPVLAESEKAEVSSEGGVVTFTINHDNDIPSDGNPHRTTIFSQDYPARSTLIAMPRLVSFAYLQATVTNPTDGVTILPGEASIYRDEIFVGKTRLDNVLPGQEFKVDLGIDERIRIERDLVEREVDKRLLGGQRRTTYAYRLRLTNLTEGELSLKLTEQLPVSRHEGIKVKLLRTTPQIQPGELGILDWTVVLPPKAKREVYYQFVIEQPADLTITGLGI